MKKTTLFSLLLLFITSTLFAQTTKTAQVTISGKIVDTKTNQPLEYATVILKDVKTKQLSGGITDEKGNFNINIPKGTYDISF
jgi:type 1 fimbria pilin